MALEDKIQLPEVTVTPEGSTNPPTSMTAGMDVEGEPGVATVPGSASQVAGEGVGTADEETNLMNVIHYLESNEGQNQGPSSAGALGDMQVNAQAHPEYDAQKLATDRNYNVNVGGEILHDLYTRYGGDPDSVLVGYNAGEGHLKQWLDSNRDNSVLPQETQNYLENAHKYMMDKGLLNPAASSGNETPAADPWDEVRQKLGIQANSLDHQPVQSAPQNGDPWAEVRQTILKEKLAQQAQGTMDPAESDFWNSVGSLFSQAGRGTARGVTDLLGLPSDIFNGLSNFYAQHPNAAIAMVNPYGLSDPSAGEPLALTNPNAVGPHLPFTSGQVRTMAEDAIFGKGALSSPEETGNTDTGQTMAFHAGEFIGAGFSPFGIAGRITKAGSLGKAAISLLWHDLVAPASVSTGADLGADVVGYAGGSPSQQQAAKLAVPLGIGARAGLTQAIVGGVSGGKKAASAIKDIVTGGPHPTVAAADETEKAISNLQAGPGNLPQGFQVPGATMTQDLPIQQMFWNLVHTDTIANARFRQMQNQNISTMEGMRPGGDAQDTISYLRNLETQQKSVIDWRLSQAKQEAQAAELAATKNLMVGGSGKINRFDLSQAYVDEILKARDDVKAMADQAWDMARASGYTNTLTVTKGMYDRLEGMMGSALRARMPDKDFPWEELSPLYKDNPKGMFELGPDKQWRRNPDTTGANGSNGPNTSLPDQVSLDQLKAVDSNLANSIRQEQERLGTAGIGGNAVRLRNLIQARNAVWDTIESGARDAGGNVSANLEAAMNATRLLHSTFDSGVIGQILSTELKSNPTLDAGGALTRYLSNTNNAIQAARAFRDVTAKRTEALIATGQAHIGAHPADQMNNTLSDWLRQDYLLHRYEQGPTGGRQWLDNHSAFFEQASGPMAQLQQDIERLNQADATVPNMTLANKTEHADVENRAVHNFLGGDPGMEISAAFKRSDPYQGMKDLIEATQKDDTGNAFRGLQGMMFDRVMAEARIPNASLDSGYSYSFDKAQKFIKANEGAFRALREADPVVGEGLDKIVNALSREDKMSANPGVVLPSTAKPLPSNAMELGHMGAQIIGAHVGRRFPQAGIQLPAIGAEYGGRLFDRFAAKVIPGAAAKQSAALNDLREALFDPAKLKAILKQEPLPGSNMEVGGHGIEPFMQAAVVQSLQNANPQTPPGPEDKNERQIPAGNKRWQGY